MSCENWRERVALYAGDDLTPPEIEAVDQHLAVCPECAELAAALRADREFLSADFPAPDYAAIRRNVRAAIVRKRIGRYSAVAGLAAAALITVFIRAPKPAPMHIASVPVSAPVIATVEPPAPPPVHRAPVRHAAIPGADQPSVAMYIATRDPKVTILLLPVKQEIANE